MSDLIEAFRRILAEHNAIRPQTGTIYFIQRQRQIKVGFTTQLKGRFSAIKSSAPDELLLLATMKGSRAMEHALHLALATRRHRGEWFKMDQEFIAAIKSVAKWDRRHDFPGALPPMPDGNGDEYVFICIERPRTQGRRLITRRDRLDETFADYRAKGYSVFLWKDMRTKA